LKTINLANNRQFALAKRLVVLETVEQHKHITATCWVTAHRVDYGKTASYWTHLSP